MMMTSDYYRLYKIKFNGLQENANEYTVLFRVQLFK